MRGGEQGEIRRTITHHERLRRQLLHGEGDTLARDSSVMTNCHTHLAPP